MNSLFFLMIRHFRGRKTPYSDLYPQYRVCLFYERILREYIYQFPVVYFLLAQAEKESLTEKVRSLKSNLDNSCR